METKEIIKKLRKDKNLRVDDVVAGTGISKGVYPKYESGILNPGVPVLCKLADFYGVSVDYLLGRSSTQTTITEREMTEQLAKAFIEVYRQLPPNAQQIAMENLRNAAKNESEHG